MKHKQTFDIESKHKITAKELEEKYNFDLGLVAGTNKITVTPHTCQISEERVREMLGIYLLYNISGNLDIEKTILEWKQKGWVTK